MFYERQEKEKKDRKPKSQAQKDKIWRRDSCDNCGRKADGLFTSYEYKKIELLVDSEDRICKRCVNKRKEAVDEMLQAQANRYKN